MLILANATLYYRGGGSTTDLDENGNPIVGTDMQSSCRCNIQTTTEAADGKYNEGGLYKKGSYTIFVDMNEVGEQFNPKVVTLQHDMKGDLGQFQVVRLEPYTLTRSYQLWV